MIAISNKDIQALKQTKKVMYCKFEILDANYKVITNPFEGKVLSGNYSINADSDIRRTCNLTIALKNDKDVFNEDILYNHYLRIYIGYTYLPTKEILYYNIGIYMFDKESFSYDISTNQLSFSLCDLTALMDVEHKGALYGAETYTIAATDIDTGKRKTNRNELILKNIVTNLLKKDYKMKTAYRIDDIGIRNRKDTSEYKWDELPYDLDFNIGSGFLDILKQIRDLYSNYEFFFDVDGTFIFQEKPSTKHDMIFLKNDLISSLVVSENTDRTVFDVKNTIEVWGKSINFEKDMRNVSGEYSNGCYNVTSTNYTETGYVDGLKLAIKVNTSNDTDNTYISLNNLEKRILHDKTSIDSTGTVPLARNKMMANNTYIVEYSAEKKVFYFLGSFQVHALAVMTNGGTNEYLTQLYNDYVEKYNTNNIQFIVDPNNKYSIEKVGEIRKSFHGDNYANLDTDAIALDYAIDKLNELCRKVTSLSLEMILVPWLDVNQKITYKPSNSDEEKIYITQSISGDLLSGVMSVSLREYYDTLDI